jgi:hypothetical protein
MRAFNWRTPRICGHAVAGSCCDSNQSLLRRAVSPIAARTSLNIDIITTNYYIYIDKRQPWWFNGARNATRAGERARFACPRADALLRQTQVGLVGTCKTQAGTHERGLGIAKRTRPDATKKPGVPSSADGVENGRNHAAPDALTEAGFKDRTGPDRTTFLKVRRSRSEVRRRGHEAAKCGVRRRGVKSTKRASQIPSLPSRPNPLADTTGQLLKVRASRSELRPR